VKKFIALTQTGEQTAIHCLQSSDWKLDLASDNYFSNPDMYYRELDAKKIEQLFNKYRDGNDTQKISSEGVIKFLEDLQLSPESRLVLIIAWKFRAQTQCEFSRDEFVNGLCDLGVDSVDKLKQKLPQLELDLNDINKFKDFYHFTFNYAKESGQKGLDLDMAIAYWNIVLKDRFKFLDLWCKFLTVSVRYNVPSNSDYSCLVTFSFSSVGKP
jgi:DCN1-like protein 1/2